MTQLTDRQPLAPSRPRVSVICAFFNGRQFLAEAIESVLAQDHQDFELLLADDGSTDGSDRVAQDYARHYPERIRYLSHPARRNLGTSPTRRMALKHAVGEFVAIIDSDDRWRPNKLSQQLAVMAAYPSVAMVCGTVNYWSSWSGGNDRLVATGNERDKWSPPPRTLFDLYPLGHADAPCPSDILLRKSALDAIGGFGSELTGPIQMYEDQTFLTKIYLSAPVFFSRHVWLDYRQHPDSCVSTVYRDRLYEGMRRDFLRWLADYVRVREVDGAGEILRAIDRAEWELRHPAAGRVLRRLRRTAWKLRRRLR